MANGLGLQGAYGVDAMQQELVRMVEEQAKRKLAEQQEAHRQAQLALQTRGMDIDERQGDARLGFEGRRVGLSESQDAYGRQRDTQADEATAARQQQIAGYIKGLPSHLQGSAQGSQFGINIKPEDFVNAPETREQQEARERARIRFGTDEEIRQARSMPRSEGSTRLVQVAGPDGQAIYVPESQAAGMPAAQAQRGVMGAERQTLAYFNRAKEADELAQRFEEPIAQAGLFSQMQQQYAPNMLQTADQQSYRQAQRAFTEARLRKESGAAIPQGEYDTDARTYFAQPGDSPQVREQKRKQRQTVLDGLKFSSGRAYDEFYGGQPASSGPSNLAGEFDFVNGKLVPRKKQ